MRTIISELPMRRNFLKGRNTIEVGYPWLTYGAIIAMEYYLKPTDNVLELGTGGSTIFFSRRCKSVKSYDMQEKWQMKVKNVLPNPSNVVFVCGKEEELLNEIEKEPDDYFDWVLVDISDDCRFRMNMLVRSTPKVKRGGYLVVDNYENPNLVGFDYTGWDTYTFDDFRYPGRGTKICIKQ